MEKLINILFLIPLALLSATAWGKNAVQIIEGFAVVGATPVRNISSLEPDTVLYCNPLCRIVSGDKLLVISFSGFGPFKEMVHFNTNSTSAAQALQWFGGHPSGVPASRDVAASAPNPEPEKKPEPEPASEVPPPDRVAEKTEEINIDKTKDTSVLKIEKANPSASRPIFKVPFPKPDSIFLTYKSQRFLVFPKVKCEQNCSVKIKMNGEDFKSVSFGPKEVPMLELKFEKNIDGVVEVNFTEAKEKIDYSFEIHPYTSQGFAKALRANRPLEILR